MTAGNEEGFTLIELLPVVLSGSQAVETPQTAERCLALLIARGVRIPVGV
jgi:hypothetical protein